MILQVSRGYITVNVDGSIARVPGEMFFLPHDKLGFTVFESLFVFWNHETKDRALTKEDRERILGDIKNEFERGGHLLEIG